MMVQVSPCGWGGEVAHVVAAVGSVITACFTAFLAHRRVKADAVAAAAREKSAERQAYILARLRHLHSRLDGNGPEP